MSESFWDRFVTYYASTPSRRRGRRRDEVLTCTGVGLLSDSPEENDRLLDEILSKRRTAIITLQADWPEGKEFPHAEEYHVLMDSQGQERCVIRTGGAYLTTFRDMREDFALAEGRAESMNAWRNRTREIIKHWCAVHGQPFSVDMPMVVETFTMVYWEE